MPCRDLPSNMRETQYPGYYITEEGDADREPLSKGERMPINEYGLVYLKPALRGHAKYPEKQYYCINITLRDENGKWLKQIKECNHRLVAEAFIDNPKGYNEVLHGNKGHRCNHYTNLKWGTHRENMEEVISPCTEIKSYTITDTITGQVWKGENLAQWVRDNYKIIEPRMRNKQTIRKSGSHLANARHKNTMLWGLIVEY